MLNLFSFSLAPPLLYSSLGPLTFQSQALCLESQKSVILTLLVGELFIMRITLGLCGRYSHRAFRRWRAS